MEKDIVKVIGLLLSELKASKALSESRHQLLVESLAHVENVYKFGQPPPFKLLEIPGERYDRTYRCAICGYRSWMPEGEAHDCHYWEKRQA